MIRSIEVHNFQILKNVKLEFGNFTVVVGRSGSGKSSLMRAMSTLINNPRGSNYITAGEKVTSIIMYNDDWKITYERSGTKSAYYLVNLETEKDMGKIPKMDGAVPDFVSDAIGIQPFDDKHSLVYADQRKDPYLIGGSGADSAKILGELTNVNTIFAAVQEANRRHKNNAATLTTRQLDLKDVAKQIEAFDDLEDELSLIDDIDARIIKLRALEMGVINLHGLIKEGRKAEFALDSIRIPSAPDITELEELSDRTINLRELLDSVVQNTDLYTAATSQLKDLADQEKSLHEGVHKLLIDAGECPTCGQVVSDG